VAFDVNAARQSGYSVAEITDHLATEQNFDIAGAKASGYSENDILSHLSGEEVQVAPEETGFAADFSSRIKNPLENIQGEDSYIGAGIRYVVEEGLAIGDPAEQAYLEDRRARTAKKAAEDKDKYEFNFSELVDSVLDHPGAVTAEMANLMMADPELLFLPIGWARMASAGKKLGTAAKFGQAATKVTEVTAGMGGTALLGGGVIAAGSAIKQYQQKGEIDWDEVKEEGMAGGVGSVALVAALRSGGAVIRGMKKAASAKGISDKAVNDTVVAKMDQEELTLDEALNATFDDMGVPREADEIVKEANSLQGAKWKDEAQTVDPYEPTNYDGGIDFEKVSPTTSLGAAEPPALHFSMDEVVPYEAPRLTYEQFTSSRAINPVTKKPYTEATLKKKYKAYKENTELALDGVPYKPEYVRPVHEMMSETYNTHLEQFTPEKIKIRETELGFGEIEGKMDTAMTKAWREALARKRQTGEIDPKLLGFMEVFI